MRNPARSLATRAVLIMLSFCLAFLGRPAIAQDAAPDDANKIALALRNDQPVRAPHAMVVTVHHLATDAGVEVLKQGGNAVDAAVAVGFALAVVHPVAGNIGGGGFMLVHLGKGPKHDLFIDYRE